QFKKAFQLISEIRSLSADCLPSLLDASVSGVSASQLLGRSVAYFFHPLRMTGKNIKNNLVLNRFWNKTSQQFFLLKHKLIGTEGKRLLREKRGRETPQACRGGSRTARGKRVPEVEINLPILQTQKKTVGKQLLSSFEQ
ncbi:hypothetical protein P4555_01210, partial [Peribacillus frigoritolerans]|uniref:hypothetical protein n=1 Tax=Peribacillus frigoritolerans TaxID=450367 RepID=UPI002E1F93CE|nr:hypothetical protein [Peribacillus frigoritolerans]